MFILPFILFIVNISIYHQCEIKFLACSLIISDLSVNHTGHTHTNTKMVQISCKYTGCGEVIEHESEAIAIAMYNSHNGIHTQATAAPQRAAVKAPPVPRPILKQDVPAEEWCTFLQEWKQFKK